jgi:hypothetical protein
MITGLIDRHDTQQCTEHDHRSHARHDDKTPMTILQGFWRLYVRRAPSFLWSRDNHWLAHRSRPTHHEWKAPIWSCVSGPVTRAFNSGTCPVPSGEVSGPAKGDVWVTGSNRGRVTRGGRWESVLWSIGKGGGVVVAEEDAAGGTFKRCLINRGFAGGPLRGNGVSCGGDCDVATGCNGYCITPCLGGAPPRGCSTTGGVTGVERAACSVGEG